MSPADVRHLADREIVDLLTSSDPNSEALAWLAGIVSNPVAVEGVNELRRRYAPKPGFPISVAKRMHAATTVFVDRQRWNAFWFRRRITLSQVGPMMRPERCEGWASVIGHKGRAGYYALDDLATSLDMRVDDLIWEVGTDAERERLMAYA